MRTVNHYSFRVVLCCVVSSSRSRYCPQRRSTAEVYRCCCSTRPLSYFERARQPLGCAETNEKQKGRKHGSGTWEKKKKKKRRTTTVDHRKQYNPTNKQTNAKNTPAVEQAHDESQPLHEIPIISLYILSYILQRMGGAGGGGGVVLDRKDVLDFMHGRRRISSGGWGVKKKKEKNVSKHSPLPPL